MTFRRTTQQRGFTLVELMVAVAIVGLLSAIAMPRMKAATAHAKQTEVKANLRALYTAERSYYADHSAYTADLAAAGFGVERGNRYAYYIALPAAAMQDRSTKTTPPTTGKLDSIGADSFAHPEIKTQPTEFSTDGTLTFASNSPIPSGSVAYVATNAQASGFLARAFGTVNGIPSSGNYDAWFISSSGATVTSPCPASNKLVVPAGTPGSTFDQTQCK